MTITITERGFVIGIMVCVAVISGLFSVWNARKSKQAAHGTTALAYGMSAWAAGFMCLVSAGVASLVSQYG